MKKMAPGDMYNKFQAKKGKLRSADAVVKSEQNASHQFGKVKKTGKTNGKSNKLGGEGRFAQVAAKAGGGKKGAAIAAVAGMKKYGKAKMSKMAKAGKNRAAKKA